MKKRVVNILIAVLILIFVACALYLASYYRQARRTGKQIDNLRELKQESLAAAADTDTGTDTDTDTEESDGSDTEADEKDVLAAYQALLLQNSHLIGWIQIEDTPIDYPVMQTAYDPQHYLHRNFEGNYDANGLPFLDADCDIDDANSNLVVYGHHMRSGMMFAHLEDFADESFYEGHKTVKFDSVWEEREYEIVAACYAQADDDFHYYDYIGALDRESFETYVENVCARSCYDTGIVPQYGDQLLSLVTCSYHTDDERFVLVAKRVK